MFCLTAVSESILQRTTDWNPWAHKSKLNSSLIEVLFSSQPFVSVTKSLINTGIYCLCEGFTFVTCPSLIISTAKIHCLGDLGFNMLIQQGQIQAIAILWWLSNLDTSEVCIKLPLPEVFAVIGHLSNAKMTEELIWWLSGINLDMWILEML